MPEPVTATEGEQGEATAAAPQESPADKPTTTTQSEGQPEASSDFQSVADLLDIPPELQKQILPKAEKPETQTEPAEPETEEAKEPEGKEVSKEEADEETPEEEDSEDEEKEEKPAEQKIDKRQKRINRLTRQRSQLEKQVEDKDGEIEDLRGKLQKFEKSPPQGMVPKVGPWMPDRETADNYADLTEKKAKAKATAAWCDRNKDGMTIVENGQEKFISAEEVTDWKREANEQLMEINPQIAVIERDAKQTFRQQKTQFDHAANTFWPELADKSSKDYQLAASILEEYPDVKHSPAAQYAVGLVIEGMRSLQVKIAAANGKSPQAPKKHKDIDERVFTTPRIPIAPHAPGPPTREATPSSHKKLDEAMDRLRDDVDGSAESLARVFEAREAVIRRPTARSPVRS